jgi:hypothetical protein
MDMLNIGVIILMAAVAAALAYALVRPREGNVGAFVVFLLLLVFVSEYLGHKFVLPQAQAAFGPKSLPDDALFTAIKKHEPALYERLSRGYVEAYKSGDKEAFIRGAYDEVAKAALKHIPTASDEAVSAFIGHAIVQLKELRTKPGDVCFRFLFPQVSGPADIALLLPKPMIDANSDKLAAIINTSVDSPRQPPTQEEALPSLQPILQELTRTYGADLNMISNPSAPTVDRRRVCDISIDLYERIGALPVHERANVLKFILKGATG